jgi:lipoate-protein ligase B
MGFKVFDAFSVNAEDTQESDIQRTNPDVGCWGIRSIDLGLTDFKQAWQFQKEVFQQVRAGLEDPALIFCRHYPVITFGRQAKRENIKASPNELADQGILVYEVERGGDVSYHGPGQLTVYPVVNLNYLKKDIHWFLRELEGAVINWLAGLGVASQRYAGYSGVWVGEKKIASIGIAIKNWVTFHGISVNIKENDLAGFGLIRPCGMDIKMTSLETVLGRQVDVLQIKDDFIANFQRLFLQGGYYD